MSDLPASPDAQPEYLGSYASRPPRRPRQRLVLAGAVLGVAAVGVGGWGLAQLMASGDDPASAVPALAVGYVAVDLDPSATQKIEALRMLKKFPVLDEELDLGIRDDIRRWVFEQLQEEAGCPVDYQRDVEPWLGNRMAVAAVPDGDAVVAPLLVVQVTEQDAARAGVAVLEDCATADDGRGGDGPGGDQGGDQRGAAGVAFVGDYMLVAESQEDADSLAKAAEAAPLGDDPAFADWMDRVGDPGVLTAYASKDAPRLMARAAQRGQTDLGGDGAGMMDDAPRLPFAGMADQTQELWKDFEGMAAVVRFSDGSMEAEMVSGGLPQGAVGAGDRTGPSLADLPEGTAAAFTVSLPDGWLDGYADAMFGMLSAGESKQDFWDGLEAGTGLQLPDDIETLLGDGVSLSVDSSVDPDAFMAPEMPEVPVALRIAGDPGAITGVLDKLLALVGPDAQSIVVESGDGVVVVGLDRTYVDALVAGGSLGESESFRSVVPEADRASTAFFVDFDAGDGWLQRLAEGDAEARANFAPLDALGASGWRDGDVQHGLLRLTTD